MIQITRTGKHTLIVHTPVMNAAGILGFGNTYHSLINLDKLGAIITNPITYEPYSPASGTRVVPLPSGVLVHTGLPNGGLSATVKEYSSVWSALPVPLIVHLVCRTPSQVTKAMQLLDQTETVHGVELGLHDDITWEETEEMVHAATFSAEKPVLVRLPVYAASEIAEAAAGTGAGAIVVAAPPRGTAHDPRSGRLINGRVYGPLVKPMVLHLVETLRRRLDDVPIIGAGGIHSTQDARDYIEAGAVAVQVDAVAWVQPRMIERIARDLGGGLVTRMSDALPDEWHPDMGDTEFRRMMGDESQD